MKETTKRILSLVLAFVMVLGLLPGLSVNVSAEGDTHYLMFATDRHANTSVIGNIINNMESTIGENALEYLALGGDMVGSGNTHPTYKSSTVLSEVTGATSSLNAANVDIVAGIEEQDHFIIEGSSDVRNQNTTKVFNVKSDASHRYSAYGAYSNVGGEYTSTQSNTKYTANVVTDFDYCNTTVAFAVVWTQMLKEGVCAGEPSGFPCVFNKRSNPNF